MCIKNNENLTLNIAASLGNYKCACLIFFYYQPIFNVENLNTVIMDYFTMLFLCDSDNNMQLISGNICCEIILI